MIEKKSIVSGKKEKFLIKPKFNESINHCFVINDIGEYLKAKGIDVKMYNTRKPDLVFMIDKKRYAIEVETGIVLTKDRKKFLEKVKYLKKHYD